MKDYADKAWLKQPRKSVLAEIAVGIVALALMLVWVVLCLVAYS